MLPNFFIVGAPKCGTTSLAEIIAAHPEGFVCEPKEPRFFSHDSIYARGQSWYEGLFADAEGCTAIGDASTSYITHSRDARSAERIHELLPDAKIIYCVRNPLRRIESIWMEHHFARASPERNFSEGNVTQSFCRDVEANPGFLETSSYWSRLSTYRRFFSDDQILVVFLEERMRDPEKSMANVFRFLGLDENRFEGQRNHASLISAQRLQPNMLGSLALKIPGWHRGLDMLPKSMRRLAIKATQSRFKYRPQWSPELLTKVSERLIPEIMELLAYAGKPKDFWTLE